MKLSKGILVTFQMTRQQALEMGLLSCTCGHPINNHFDHDAHPCAQCQCLGYNEKARVGKLL
jgi:hypothetical protein